MAKKPKKPKRPKKLKRPEKPRPQPKRSRTVRREAERAVEKLAAARRKLHRLEAGGAPDHPITVRSASQIESHARTLRCALCERTLFVHDSRSSVVEGTVHRDVELTCRACGEVRHAHFAIQPPVLH